MNKKLHAIVHHPYFPGIVMFLIALVIGLLTYHDYGVCWDEPYQRAPAVLSYDYIMYGSQELFIKPNDNHGAGFEILLILIEKWGRMTDTRDIYLMRHIVSHVFFLLGMLAGYVLIYKLFRNRFIASMGFFMLTFMPRMYAHSFFNSKDMPFYVMFVVAFAVLYAAFEKNKPWLFLVLGFVVGYATSIRIMGIMLALIILGFLAMDVIFKLIKKEKAGKILLNMLLFTVGFVILLYIPWPFIWKHPIKLFFASFDHLAHFDWHGHFLFEGKILSSDDPLTWRYFPTWFLMTIPELWLIMGLVGIGMLAVDFFKRPMVYMGDTRERNFLLYLLCFFAPIFSVIALKSTLYDDWRHLYFVYPAFVIIGLYFVNRFINGNYQKIVQGILLLQAALVVMFMVQNHPFGQVYFNNLVSHEDEYLRKNYDLEYWGCGFKQGLDHLLENEKKDTIRICCEYTPLLNNNVMLLPKEERHRFKFSMFDTADYYMSNFRLHPQDYPGTDIEYEIKVLNSTILRVYKLKPKVKLP